MSSEATKAEVHATKAVVMGGGLRTQIMQMSQRDGLGASEISALLGVPAVIVEEVLGGKARGAQGVDGELEAAQGVEAAIGQDGIADAIATLRELCVGAESEAVRSVTASKLLEYATGGLRPKRAQAIEVGVTVDTMNVLIQQAVAAHAAQLAAPGPQIVEANFSAAVNN